MKKTRPYSFKRSRCATFTIGPALSIILTLTLALTLFGFLPAMLSAATIDDLEFTLINDDTEYSVSAKDPLSITGAVEIPATYNDKPVTEIGIDGFGFYFNPGGSLAITSVSIPSSLKVIRNSAFSDCRSLTTVTFAEGSQLETIEAYAFLECSALPSIALPDSLSSLGGGAFQNCYALSSVTLPPKITTFPYSLFANCQKLTSLILPDGLTAIGEGAFSYSGLSEITIPAAVTSIGNIAFYNCSTLNSITFLGPAPTLGTNAFSETGVNVGGFTITIYDTHEASYADWRDSYTFNVIPAPDASVFLYAQTSYNPITQALSIVTQNEPTGVTINLEQANSLSGTWSILSNTAYTQSNNADTGTVTRTVSIDPAANAQGFYRLASPTESTQ